MKSFMLSLIRLYQKYLSPDTGVFRAAWLVGSACRFSPTCSEYTYQAVETYGIIRGSILGLRRILRCHPWSPGGFDPVPKP